MGVALFGNYRFRIDPSAVAWSFKIKAADTKTIGGKVVQVFGTEMGDMTVDAYFGKSGHAEQDRLFAYLNQIGTYMMEGSRTKASHPPIRFVYPPRKWDFKVYLKAFTQIGQPVGVRIDPKIANVGFRLTLFIVEDNANVKKVAQDAYIARLAAGLGWKLTAYNGGTPQSAAQIIAEAGGIQQYLVDTYMPQAGG